MRPGQPPLIQVKGGQQSPGVQPEVLTLAGNPEQVRGRQDLVADGFGVGGQRAAFLLEKALDFRAAKGERGAQQNVLADRFGLRRPQIGVVPNDQPGYDSQHAQGRKQAKIPGFKQSHTGSRCKIQAAGPGKWIGMSEELIEGCELRADSLLPW